MSIPRWLSYFN